MHTIVNYGLLTGKEKRDTAVKDIKEFWGQKKFDYVLIELKRKKLSWLHFSNIVSISGVSGYPLEALYEHVYGEPHDIAGMLGVTVGSCNSEHHV